MFVDPVPALIEGKLQELGVHGDGEGEGGGSVERRAWDLPVSVRDSMFPHSIVF